MAERAVRSAPTTIDPLFYIPEDVDELTYEGLLIDDPDSENEDEVMVVVDADDVVEDDSGVGTGGSGDTPSTPSILGIIPPQVIRMSDSGAEVVDVIFDVEDVEGVTKYEVRVTKL